jgi:biotin carboxyl carrier protein
MAACARIAGHVHQEDVMRYVAQIEGRPHTVDVPANGHTRSVSVDGRDLTVDWQLVGATSLSARTDEDEPAAQLSILSGNRSYEAYAHALPPEGTDDGALIVEVMIGGAPYRVTVRDERTQALASLAGGSHGAGDALIRAPMPGLVVNVLAAEGAEVKRGQTVVVLEAMKMENDLTAPRAGIVKAVSVVQGKTVGQGDVLVVVGDPGEAPAADEDDE